MKSGTPTTPRHWARWTDSQIAANLKATVIIQHDERDVGKLPIFPASAK
jgi:hypothetical protein